MRNPGAVLDRFGDEEFLRELWLRARQQWPREIATVEALRSCPSTPRDELTSVLHRLRGLIANFLEGSDALQQLRACEWACRHSDEGFPHETWEAFLEALEREARDLEAWLTERGFPC